MNDPGVTLFTGKCLHCGSTKVVPTTNWSSFWCPECKGFMEIYVPIPESWSCLVCGRGRPCECRIMEQDAGVREPRQ